MFGATVYEFTEKDLQGFDPKWLLAGHGTSGSEVELTRKEIEHGPNKHLGLDLTSKYDGGLYRRVNVMVGRRIYSVRFSSQKQEGLAADDVVKFFESFAVHCEATRASLSEEKAFVDRLEAGSVTHEHNLHS